MKHLLRSFAFALVTVSLFACSAEDGAPGEKTSSALGSPLVEGQECPVEKCADQAFATSADGTTPSADSVHCVAGPQVGSGVGVCQLVAE